MPTNLFLLGKNYTLALQIVVNFGNGSFIYVGSDKKFHYVGPGDPGPIEAKFNAIARKLQAVAEEFTAIALQHGKAA